MRIYILREGEFPWGDYGHCLVHGIGSYRAPENEKFQLERCGPFIPPITFPYKAIIVTDSFRERLETQRFSGMSFQPVDKYHIVELDWHRWEQSAEEPLEYPEEGEPEGYMLERQHSPKAATALGNLWQLHPKIVEDTQVKGEMFYTKNYSGEDICRASKWGYTYISETLKRWLTVEVPQWICCRQVNVVTDM